MVYMTVTYNPNLSETELSNSLYLQTLAYVEGEEEIVLYKSWYGFSKVIKKDNVYYCQMQDDDGGVISSSDDINEITQTAYILVPGMEQGFLEGKMKEKGWI